MSHKFEEKQDDKNLSNTLLHRSARKSRGRTDTGTSMNTRDEHKSQGRDADKTPQTEPPTRNAAPPSSPATSSLDATIPARIVITETKEPPTETQHFTPTPLRLAVPKTPDSPSINPMLRPSPAPSPLQLPSPLIATSRSTGKPVTARNGEDRGRDAGLVAGVRGASDRLLRPSSRVRVQSAAGQGGAAAGEETNRTEGGFRRRRDRLDTTLFAPASRSTTPSLSPALSSRATPRRRETPPSPSFGPSAALASPSPMRTASPEPSGERAEAHGLAAATTMPAPATTAAPAEASSRASIAAAQGDAASQGLVAPAAQVTPAPELERAPVEAAASRSLADTRKSAAAVATDSSSDDSSQAFQTPLSPTPSTQASPPFDIVSLHAFSPLTSPLPSGGAADALAQGMGRSPGLLARVAQRARTRSKSPPAAPRLNPIEKSLTAERKKPSEASAQASLAAVVPADGEQASPRSARGVGTRVSAASAEIPFFGAIAADISAHAACPSLAPSPVTKLVPIALDKCVRADWVTDISSPLPLKPARQDETPQMNGMNDDTVTQGLSATAAADSSVVPASQERGRARSKADIAEKDSTSGDKVTTSGENTKINKEPTSSSASDQLQEHRRAVERPSALHEDDAEGYMSPEWVDADNEEELVGRKYDNGHVYGVLGGSSLLDTLESLQESEEQYLLEIEGKKDQIGADERDLDKSGREDSNEEGPSDAERSPGRRRVSISVGNEGLLAEERPVREDGADDSEGPVLVEVRRVHSAVDEAVSATVSAILQVAYVAVRLVLRAVNNVAGFTVPYIRAVFMVLWTVISTAVMIIDRTPIGVALNWISARIWFTVDWLFGPLISRTRGWAGRELRSLYYMDKRYVVRAWDVTVGFTYLAVLLAINLAVDALRLGCLAVKSVLALPLFVYWTIASLARAVKRLGAKFRGTNGHVALEKLDSDEHDREPDIDRGGEQRWSGRSSGDDEMAANAADSEGSVAYSSQGGGYNFNQRPSGRVGDNDVNAGNGEENEDLGLIVNSAPFRWLVQGGVAIYNAFAPLLGGARRIALVDARANRTAPVAARAERSLGVRPSIEEVSEEEEEEEQLMSGPARKRVTEAESEYKIDIHDRSEVSRIAPNGRKRHVPALAEASVADANLHESEAMLMAARAEEQATPSTATALIWRAGLAILEAVLRTLHWVIGATVEYFMAWVPLASPIAAFIGKVVRDVSAGFTRIRVYAAAPGHRDRV